MNSGRVPALELCNVCKTFGGLKATDNISIEVKEHEIYGIIGPNGAGKTTLFNILLGFYRPTAGRITIDGKEYLLREGESIVMPARHPHAVYGQEPFKMLLVVVF